MFSKVFLFTLFAVGSSLDTRTDSLSTQYDQMTIPELKDFLSARGKECNNCVDQRDFAKMATTVKDTPVLSERDRTAWNNDPNRIAEDARRRVEEATKRADDVTRHAEELRQKSASPFGANSNERAEELRQQNINSPLSKDTTQGLTPDERSKEFEKMHGLHTNGVHNTARGVTAEEYNSQFTDNIKDVTARSNNVKDQSTFNAARSADAKDNAAREAAESNDAARRATAAMDNARSATGTDNAARNTRSSGINDRDPTRTAASVNERDAAHSAASAMDAQKRAM